jgi:hypothetical protein
MENRTMVDSFVEAIPLGRGTRYCIPEVHRLAHVRHDPLLAPHGFFRALRSKRNSDALEFVEKFGPLDWSMTSEIPNLVLGDFWLKHLRYVSVVRLWESRDDEVQLRDAFSDLQKNLDRIHFAEGWQGAVPLFPLDSSDLPWEKSESSFEEQLNGTTFEELHEAAIKVFHGELNLHLFERKPRWLRNDVDDSEQPPSFQFVLGGGNLWQMIWELTGLDTAKRRSWRICPDCNALFYPKRSDQYYCKSEEQIRASKRNYARTRRERERLEKLFASTEDKPNSKLVRKKHGAVQRNGEQAKGE